MSESESPKPDAPQEQVPGGSSLSDIVGEAGELEPSQRDVFLVRACAGDANLLERARMLVRSHEEAQNAGFFAQPTATSLGGLFQSSVQSLEPGATLGFYTVVRCVGTGGFGEVYEATQDRPIQRRVAIKVLRIGMDTPQVVARFESERRALAMMDHPGIAKVLDAGTTPKGLPFVVMEFVDGQPLMHFCNQQQLGIRERLSLVVQVCRALQHAHVKGIIHRDIKPSNILACMQDGKAITRIIDFGIAKAIEHVAAARTAFTRDKQMIGTPEYMSPEQAGAAPDIDTRSDIYSLGVVLYELLAGVGPFDSKKLRSAAFAELERVLREDDPPKPSTRLSAMSEASQKDSTLSAIASQRKIDPAALLRALRGELDWIVMRCLEKDRARRYESASALGDDLERYLRDDPVLARPPSRTYEALKFAKRHRVGLTAAGVALLSLVVGLGVSLASLQRARQAAKRAETARAEERTSRERAEQQARKAQAASEFLENVLSSADPDLGGPDFTVRAALEQAVAQLEGGELTKEPEVEAISRRAIGMSLLALGAEDEGASQLLRAVDLSATPGFDPIDRARCLFMHGVALFRQEHYQIADSRFSEAILILRGQVGEDAERELLSCLTLRSSSLFWLDRADESRQAFNEAGTLSARLYGTDSVEYTDLFCSQAAGIHSNPRDLQPLRNSIAAHRRTYGPNHPRLARRLGTLGSSLLFTSDLNGMVDAFEESIRIYEHAFGPRSRRVASVRYDLGSGFNSFGAFDEARQQLEPAAELLRESLQANDASLLMRIELDLGLIEYRSERFEAAERHFRASAEAGQSRSNEALGFIRFGASAWLAETLLKLDRPDEARAVAQAVYDARDQFTQADWQGVFAQSTLGELLTRDGKFAQAEAMLAPAAERVGTMFYFRGGRQAIMVLERLITLYERWEKAEPNRGYIERTAPYREILTQRRERLAQRIKDYETKLAAFRAARATKGS